MLDVDILLLYYMSTPRKGAMIYLEVIWDDEPSGNVEHIAEHDLTLEDVEAVLCHPLDNDISRSSGLPIVFGFTPVRRYILVVYERLSDVKVYPITAYDVEE
ncbi:MAG: hypothetical protein AAF939_19150 [Planctomycetota bacterium]